ncbi:MAG: 4-(cytidine 5'-diphospho)-2-C-methyl-D-erythritol kinase [Nitrospinae bacterium]|nr:4-(cytidine 5'-diphospho)-2-C-methyl-D-erythritol kinase [Nitrospinota bacterium]
MKTIKIKSPAKINLGLKVVGKRSDGYHNIETIFQMVSLYDDITLIESESGITLYSNNKNIPLNEKNLAYRAAYLLRERTGVKKGVKIEIDKNIPVSAGLGGGSSNAAVTLLGLNHIWELKLPKEELLSIARLLGADVPFFLSGVRALGTGRGDELQILPVADKFYVILLNLGFSISTEWVYKNLKLELTKERKNINIKKFISKKGAIGDIRDILSNDLESVVMEKYDVIGRMKELLLSAGAYGSLMSGSGSTVFGIFKDYSSAKQAGEMLKREEWSLFLTEALTGLDKIYPGEVIV